MVRVLKHEPFLVFIYKTQYYLLNLNSKVVI